MARMLFPVVVVLALAGCGGGPPAEALRKDVEARLAQALPPGAVALSAFDRRGSQADTKAPAGQTQRIVYYDLELKLQRDLDLGAWDAPGVAGLVSALGAGPKGIVGIQTGGNKAGDTVRAHGKALYRREGDAWVAVAAGGFQPSQAPAYATNAPGRGPAAMLEAMRKMVDAMPKDAAPSQIAVIEEELAAAQATIRARLARASDGYAIAAGPANGQYLRLAQALASGAQARIVPLVTLGGEENLQMLRDGKVALALAQGDAALAAYEGSGAFAGRGADPNLRAAGSLYPEPVHVIVRADSPLGSIGELRGRRVAIGVAGSASRTTALRVLEAHGVTLAQIRPLELSLADGLVGLGRKDVDAVIQVIGVPADSIRDALSELPLRLLSLSENAVAALGAANNGLFAFTIPAASYGGQTAPVRTVATAAVLLVGASLSDAEVGTLARMVFEKGRDFAARGSIQGLQVATATARQGLTVPMHTSAARAQGLGLPASAPPALPASAASAAR